MLGPIKSKVAAFHARRRVVVVVWCCVRAWFGMSGSVWVATNVTWPPKAANVAAKGGAVCPPLLSAG